jgi:methylmalonyl-CoA/ethylmalonyl-CoA epimerase
MNTPLSFLRNGIAQFALVVEDLERTVEAYYRLFGIGPWHFYTYEIPYVSKMTRWGNPARHGMRLALSYMGPSRVEIIQHLYGDTVYADHLAKHGPGLQHLGVLVENMEVALGEARTAGLTVLQEGIGFGPDGDGHYAYLDTEGLIGFTLELIQRPAGRKPPEKIYPPG